MVVDLIWITLNKFFSLRNSHDCYDLNFQIISKTKSSTLIYRYSKVCSVCEFKWVIYRAVFYSLIYDPDRSGDFIDSDLDDGGQLANKTQNWVLIYFGLGTCLIDLDRMPNSPLILY